MSPKRHSTAPHIEHFNRKSIHHTLEYDDDWVWSKRHRSHEVVLTKPCRKAYFHPNWSKGTAGVRGTHAINSCRHYWEIHVSHRVFGTSMMFGVGTEDARLHANKFENMLGEDENGWGLSHKGLVWHGGIAYRFTEQFNENEATVIGIYFDGLNGTLTYYKDGRCLGVAFRGLNKVEKPLYPIIISTAAKTEMVVSETRRDFPSLQDRCRAEILKHIKQKSELDKLELPTVIVSYLSSVFFEPQSLTPVDNYDRP
ncbi:SPRY domain-containing SOCS box protein 3-like [Contarinia nasturtii]|uniref:SPRY domain-containing SOCS box protein 3-like n=1 Tax=Contarinia nasturtii TaxID=265458 RepID=UPI0012D39380|nr:SPRY domain-containing SOCS box protein 3-like [Contarinia nasturtii]